MAPKQYLDLEQAVSDWAWGQFDRHATRKERKLREKNKKRPHSYIGLKIDWSNVKFTDVTTWTRLADDQSDDSGANGRLPSEGPVQLQYQGKPGATSPSTASVLFQTKFTNNTTDEQEYTMRTEKTTKSSLSTTVESGYTKGFDMSVKLMTPCEVFEANAGFHREFSLTNTDGETFEEELTWGVESCIKVKPLHVAEARLVVTEKKQAGSFVIVSTIHGCVDVTFTEVKNNNSLLSATSEDIGKIVKDYVEMERRKGSPMSFVQVTGTEDEGVVTITTNGVCKFRYGVKQEARVDQKPINASLA